jgi:hypothetical protein
MWNIKVQYHKIGTYTTKFKATTKITKHTNNSKNGLNITVRKYSGNLKKKVKKGIKYRANRKLIGT